jgi:hypothetical protein
MNGMKKTDLGLSKRSGAGSEQTIQTRVFATGILGPLFEEEDFVPVSP